MKKRNQGRFSGNLYPICIEFKKGKLDITKNTKIKRFSNFQKGYQEIENWLFLDKNIISKFQKAIHEEFIPKTLCICEKPRGKVEVIRLVMGNG